MLTAPNNQAVSANLNLKQHKMKKIVLGTCLILLLAAVNANADAEANWKKNCASCHGNDGKGKTRAGRKAKVKDQTDAKVQKAYTDDQAFKHLKEGMKDDKGKEQMKPYGDKLSDAEIKDLIAYVRKFAK